MGHKQLDIGQNSEISKIQTTGKYPQNEDFVLEKNIFSSIFEKDIRRVFIYKKAERLAKAVHLITPAFTESVSLKNRIDAIAIGLIDAAILPPRTARTALSRELLALSSILSIAHTSNLLSSMNVELISHEAHTLLHEIALYEAPRLSFDDIPTLSSIAKNASSWETPHGSISATERQAPKKSTNKGHIKDIKSLSDDIKDRRDAILSIIKNKRTVSIKDISTLVRGVSEKTIQRELSTLISSGTVTKQGERRWSTYSLS